MRTSKATSTVHVARLTLAASFAMACWVGMALGAPSFARAYSTYQDNVPNGTTIGCITCHNNSGGGNPLGNGTCGTSPGSSPCWNSFASRFVAYGYAFPAGLAAEDSDGDGWSNGRELLLPGGGFVEGSANPGPTAEARTPGIAYSVGNCATWSRACAMNDCSLNYDDCDTSPVATCNELTPFFSCTCPTGYSGTGRGSGGCSNIDECSSGNPCNENILGSGNACFDATPRYNCSCGTGYSLAFDGTFSETCSDVNECTAGNPCNESVAGNSCTNTTGRWDCTCGAAGYQLTGNGTFSETCGDINECTSGNPCNEDTPGSPNTCSNLFPGNSCTCGAGYTYANGATFDFCNDINECLSAPCGVGSCVNSTGSYSCTCPGGYAFNGTTCANVNECVTMPGVCGVGSCSDSVGSYSCTCPGGYAFNGTTCEVNNACNANTDNCADAQGALCMPMGSMAWTCACPAGYVGNGITPPGGTGCSDVNECSGAPCGVGSCINTPGSYACTCPSGYSFNGTTCVDVNECVTLPGVCGLGTCANIVGSYRCSCPGGYAAPASGGTCADINECASTSTCNAASGWGSCSNTTGAYSCVCATGFAVSGSGLSLTCANVNECTASPPCGVGTCADTVGSYRCTCPVGYSAPGAGGSCEDIDECVDTSLCNAALGYGACVNDVGAFSCSCGAGFVISGSGRTQTCVNVDECATSADDCDVNAACSDDVPAFGRPPFVCTCNAGWEGPGNVCTDFDECLDDATNECSISGSCINEAGSYACACNPGYTGDGRVCADADECATADCGDNEVCINQIGVATPLCECEPGSVRGIEGTCVSSCGNGIRVAGEECDDANLNDGDGCDENCLVEPGSACAEDAAGLTTCMVGRCGDGVHEPLSYEECDDPANSDTAPDACRTNCRRAHCGDGVVDTGEACDEGEMSGDGAVNSDILPDGCRTDCRAAFCGDGVLDADEYCDDAPMRDEDGRLIPQPAETCLSRCLPDGGMPDAGVGGDVAPVNTGGCACRVGAARPITGAWALLGLGGLALLLLERRRR